MPQATRCPKGTRVNKAKLVKRRAYGYISFRNYRLRLLNAALVARRWVGSIRKGIARFP
jgi:hypothetical protein